MTNPQPPTTVNQAQADLTAAVNNLNAEFEAIATDPDVIASAGDLITELSIAIPSIIHSIEDIVECGTILAGEIVL
jgi:hypothetical protein